MAPLGPPLPPAPLLGLATAGETSSVVRGSSSCPCPCPVLTARPAGLVATPAPAPAAVAAIEEDTASVEAACLRYAASASTSCSANCRATGCYIFMCGTRAYISQTCLFLATIPFSGVLLCSQERKSMPRGVAAAADFGPHSAGRAAGRPRLCQLQIQNHARYYSNSQIGHKMGTHEARVLGAAMLAGTGGCSIVIRLAIKAARFSMLRRASSH
jgi:hypothetical protein